jgi:hypothetical protein
MMNRCRQAGIQRVSVTILSYDFESLPALRVRYQLAYRGKVMPSCELSIFVSPIVDYLLLDLVLNACCN